MPTTKARWKSAPIDQRRVASQRTAPKARFLRSQRSGALPPSLPPRGVAVGRTGKPAFRIVVALGVMIVLGVALVIAVGVAARAQQQYEDIQWRAAYYGRPTLPFATLAPQAAEPSELTSEPGGVLPLVTALPQMVNPALSISSSDAALSEPKGATGAVGDDTTLLSYCDNFPLPVSVRIFDWNDWSTVELTNPLVAQIPVGWDARADLWRGYGSAKPFDQPDDARDRWRLTFFSADGTERWIQIAQSASTPAILYAYAFQIITPYADQNGNHFGYHPCRAFALASSEMDVLISSARAYQSSGSRFPEFAAPDDPRWVRGSATPLAGGFEIRTQPTTQGNDPLQVISATVGCYFIREAEWGAWAQIKLGNTTAWVDTSAVRLDATS